MTETISLADFFVAHHITMTAEPWDHNPNMPRDSWSDTATHWRCTLKRAGHRLTVYFSQGSAINRNPSPADVLDCLASDAAGVENATGFDGWCDEYGYDYDSRKAFATYKVVEREARKLKKFLGHDAYETLLWSTERL